MALAPGWERRRAHVMLAVLRAKFNVPELRELLLSTGERILAEDSPYDAVWGCRDHAGGYRGENLLGRALMRVRDELHALRDPGRTSTGLCACGHTAAEHAHPATGDTRCLIVGERARLTHVFDDGRDTAHAYCACLRFSPPDIG